MQRETTMRGAWAAAGLVAILGAAAPAFAHGGQYPTSKGPTGGIPDDSDILHPHLPVPSPPTPATMTPWDRWWEANQDRYLHLRSRLRDRDGPRSRVSDPEEAGTGDAMPGAPPSAHRFLEREVLPVVTAALRDEDAEVRSAAAVALGKMGFPRSLLELRKALRDTDRDVRESALLGMGMLGDSLAIESLQQVLLDPKVEERERAFAALGLGMIGGLGAAEALLSYLDPSADAGRAAGFRRRPETEVCVLASLGLTREKSVSPVLAAIALEGRMPYGGKAEPTQRSFAMVAIGRLGDRAALPLASLVGLLSKDEEAERQGAAIATGLLAGPADEIALFALGRAAERDRDLNTRCHAIMGLGRIGGPKAIEALQGILKKAPQTDLPFAALALGIAGDGTSAPELLRRFREERDLSLRGSFALALGLLHHAAAAREIQELAFGKGKREARRHCMLALGMLGDTASSAALLEVVTTDNDPYLKNAAGTALGLLGDRAVVPKVAAIAQGSGQILARGHACRILGTVGNRESAKLLARLAGDRTETGYIRMFAITGLGILAERSDIPVLSSVGFDLETEVRIDALDVLAGLM